MQELYNKLKRIPKNLINSDKYLLLGLTALDAKYISTRDIFHIENFQIKEYIADVGDAVVFPITINNKIVSLFIRSLDSKDNPLKYNKTTIPYGFDMFDEDFKYGDPVILVEGIADLGALKLINPKYNVIAMLSNSISKESCEFLKEITNNFVIITDNDKAGDIGFKTIRKRLSGNNVRRIIPYGTTKDPGDIIDLLLKYRRTKDTFIKTEIDIIKSYYLNSIGENV